jgi:hypothetical protein
MSRPFSWRYKNDGMNSVVDFCTANVKWKSFQGAKISP